MRVISIHERERIEPFLRRNVYLHVYALGDLDPFFWPYTTWYVLEDQGEIRAIMLLFIAYDPPTLLALAQPPVEPMHELLCQSQHLLPPRIYGHITPQCVCCFEASHDLKSNGLHWKLGLADRGAVESVDTSEVAALSVAHLEQMQAFYAESYPGNWFDARMLETGFYYGMFQGSRLASVAGVHVYSPETKVAALGNIATHPDFRGRGFGRLVTARLCQELGRVVDDIGLNVKATNGAAIACYEKLGFRKVGEYEECLLTRKS